MKNNSASVRHSRLAWHRLLVFGSFLAFTLALTTSGRLNFDSNLARAAQGPIEKSLPAQSGPADSKNQGCFKLRYEPRKTLRRKSNACRVGSDRETVQRIIDSLNETVSLPSDIYLVFKNCGDSDVYYDHETREIQVCYEWMDRCGSLYSPTAKSISRCNEDVKGAFAFALFHEMAHAIIDSLKLPVTGKEEDVADQFASLLLLEKIENGGNLALAAALGFKLYAQLEKNEKKIYWDEHSLDEQRFYEITCMVYGRDPEKYSYLARKGTLPWQRAELCVEDYPKIKSAWQRLLAPYAKTPLKSDSANRPQ